MLWSLFDHGLLLSVLPYGVRDLSISLCKITLKNDLTTHRLHGENNILSLNEAETI